MANNMEVWNRVCNTDPRHTKQVDTRGGFTAIDAMYQVQNATEVFGPAGKGWGWYTGDPIYPGNGTVVIKVTLWHGDRSTSVEQFGQKAMNWGDKPDEDAFKKCVTDGLTKCLSYLGFNADVFLGRFDDSKYVKEMTRKFAPSDPQWGNDKALFEKELGVHGLSYDDVAAWCESLGRRQPKHMTSDQRSRLLDYLNSDAGKVSYNDWLSVNQ
mgnify:CR=1 FL=1